MKASEHTATRWSLGAAVVALLPFLLRGSFLEVLGILVVYVLAYGAGHDLAEKNAKAKTEEES